MRNYDEWIAEVVLCRRTSKLAAEKWNDLPRKPEARTVQNFYKRLQSCVVEAVRHFRHFMTDIPYIFSDRKEGEIKLKVTLISLKHIRSLAGRRKGQIALF